MVHAIPVQHELPNMGVDNFYYFYMLGYLQLLLDTRVSFIFTPSSSLEYDRWRAKHAYHWVAAAQWAAIAVCIYRVIKFKLCTALIAAIEVTRHFAPN